jgi:hypothetical protein
MIVMLLHTGVDLPSWFCIGEVSNGMRCKGTAALALLLVTCSPRRLPDSFQVATARMKHDILDPWPAFTPCDCPGKCGADCPCLANKNWCALLHCTTPL